MSSVGFARCYIWKSGADRDRDHLKIASYGIFDRDQIEMKLAIEFRTIKQLKKDTFMVEYLQ